MKKQTLTVLTVLCSICLLIFACRKDIKNSFSNDPSNVSNNLLETAKVFDTKFVADNAALNAKIPGFVTLKPQWDDAWSVDSGANVKFVTVPTIENNVSNRSVSIRRLFIFKAVNNKIVNGQIVMFVGINNYKVDDHLDELIKNLHNPSASGLSGAIIQCNLNYQWVAGAAYENGTVTTNNVSIARTLTNGGSMSLTQYAQGDNGQPSISELTYLYPSKNKLRVLSDGDGTGNLGGTQSLSTVVISGGGDYPPNPTNPGAPVTPPIGSGGGNTGGSSDAPTTPVPDPTPDPTDTENGAAVATDCSSFVFTKTSTANWQEAGVKNIRLRWVWVNGSFGGDGREVIVPSVVFGLPTQYQNANGTITPNSAGKAAVTAAKITEYVKELTYKEFRDSPYSPSDDAVITYFKTQLQAAMATQRGTAGATGSGSNKIVFKNEERSSFLEYDCDL